MSCSMSICQNLPISETHLKGHNFNSFFLETLEVFNYSYKVVVLAFFLIFSFILPENKFFEDKHHIEHIFYDPWSLA